MSTSTAIIMKQTRIRDLLSSHVSLAPVAPCSLRFRGPADAAPAPGAGGEGCGALVCASALLVLLLKLMLRGEFVLAGVALWLPLRF